MTIHGSRHDFKEAVKVHSSNSLERPRVAGTLNASKSIFCTSDRQARPSLATPCSELSRAGVQDSRTSRTNWSTLASVGQRPFERRSQDSVFGMSSV